MAKGRRVWLKGENFRVYASKKDTLEYKGEAYHAWLDLENGNIEVARNLPEIMCKSLFHELVHKACYGMNPKTAADIFGETGPDELEAREEELCRYLEDKLYDLLCRNGWLKFPKPPKFR